MGPLVLVMLKRTVHYWFLLFYKSIFSVYMFYIPHSDTCIYSAGDCSAFDLYKLKNKQKNPRTLYRQVFMGCQDTPLIRWLGFGYLVHTCVASAVCLSLTLAL